MQEGGRQTGWLQQESGVRLFISEGLKCAGNGGGMGAISYICFPCQFDFPGRIALYLTGF
jgi:hypothetical protein